MPPQRIQLKRVKGFNLQAASRALNGMDAVNVARPSKWGNPYKMGQMGITTNEEAVRQFKRFMSLPETAVFRDQAQRELKGKNLACYCKLGSDQPCHADFLLAIANEQEQTR